MTPARLAKTIAPAILLAALTACTSPEERAARAQAQLAADKAECTELGFTEITEPFGNCLLKLREIRALEADTQARRQAAAQAFWGPNWPFYYDRWRRHPYGW